MDVIFGLFLDFFFFFGWIDLDFGFGSTKLFRMSLAVEKADTSENRTKLKKLLN